MRPQELKTHTKQIEKTQLYASLAKTQGSYPLSSCGNYLPETENGNKFIIVLTDCIPVTTCL